jgi:hypothetical protein
MIQLLLAERGARTSHLRIEHSYSRAIGRADHYKRQAILSEMNVSSCNLCVVLVLNEAIAYQDVVSVLIIMRAARPRDVQSLSPSGSMHMSALVSI